MSGLSRRQFVLGASATGLGLLAGCGRLPFLDRAPAPRAAEVPRIGFLIASTPSSTVELRDAFRQGLADRGYLEGRDIAVEWRFAEGFFDRVPALAAELVMLQPAAIVVGATVDAQVVQRATNTLPVVVAGSGGDLVNEGLAASLAHPGGNVTGLSTPLELAGKCLQLLMDTAPGMSKIAVFRDAITPTFARSMAMQSDYWEGFAQRLGIHIQVLNVSHPDEFDSALSAVTEEHADGVYVPNYPLLNAHRGRFIAFAAEHRLPAIYGRRLFVDDGGLMTYQPRIADLYRRSAYYVDRILKGAKPADLPVEQPMTFDFVVNLKTVRDLGITFPPEIQLQITEAIQ